MAEILAFDSTGTALQDVTAQRWCLSEFESEGSAQR